MKKVYHPFKQLFCILSAIALISTGCENPIEIESSLNGIQNQTEGPLIEYKQSQPIEGQYIVVFKDDAIPMPTNKMELDFEALNEHVRREVNSIIGESSISEQVVKRVYSSTIKGATLQMNARELNSLKNDKRVSYIEQDQLLELRVGPDIKNRLVPSIAPEIGGQITPINIMKVGGHKAPHATAKAYILDTGIDLDHEDLNVVSSGSRNFCTQGTYSNDGDDRHGHGTHVAGIIGALDNNFGVVGVSPGVKLYSIKVLNDEGVGSVSDVIAGLDYVATKARQDHVIHLSLGTSASIALDQAIIRCQTASNAFIVMSAGNDGLDVSGFSPARVNYNKVYTVSSINLFNHYSYFSNFGSSVDFSAPGENIYSTYKDNRYAILSGTSMAAPHLSGVIMAQKGIGSTGSKGNAINDPDGSPDPIVSH